MKKTSIIIPTHNKLPLLKDCVLSIKAHTTTPYEIIVVDNASTDGTPEYCIDEGLVFISNPDNRGFPGPCNMALKIASGDSLLLLNNDTMVAEHWLTNMLDALYSGEDVGIVGPMSNFASGKQQSQEPYTNLQDMAALYDTRYKSQYQQVERLIGLCFLFKRELLDRVGYLDERFSPGHFEDDDYCYRARQAGYRLVIAKDTFIYHHGSASFNEQGDERLKELLARNRRLFMEKWGVDPHSFI